MRQLHRFNNLEFRVQNSLLGYKRFIYMRWRPTLQCRRLGRWLGRRLGRGTCARANPTHDIKLNIYENYILFIILNNRFNYIFPILSFNKYYIVFDIYFINNFLFWKYKYKFELFNKKLNIDNFSNYSTFGNNFPMSNNNYNFYPIKKNNIIIYK
jgi:hypothetical protein